MYEFLSQQETGHVITDVCSSLGIEWQFIPEHSPHVGGLLEEAVKSAKAHLRHLVGEVKMTYEEISTVLAQIEVCLNSRPLDSVNMPDEGHSCPYPWAFFIGYPLYALPDHLPCTVLHLT